MMARLLARPQAGARLLSLRSTPSVGAAQDAVFQVDGVVPGNRESYDEEQIRLMEEQCILVDEEDLPLGPASKKELHLMSSTGGPPPLHRAFSVFLFDSQNRLLIQKRAHDKILFPAYWANTCCSHPWHTDEEMELEDAMGVKRAAVRKLDHELGISADQVPIEDFKYLTAVHYAAGSDDPKWGEHEVDHILFIKPTGDVDITLRYESWFESYGLNPIHMKCTCGGGSERWL